jgi:hypothetical protein
MTDSALLVGGLGLATGLFSLFYAHNQVGAARAQARAQLHAAILQSDTEMYKRQTALRDAFRRLPEFREMTAKDPELGRVVEAVGGAENYYFFRNTLDTFQEVFFLRRNGFVTDEYWHSWTNTSFAITSRLANARAVFDLCRSKRFLHPDFIAFYEPAFSGSPLSDPTPGKRKAIG